MNPRFDPNSSIFALLRCIQNEHMEAFSSRWRALEYTESLPLFENSRTEPEEVP